MIPYNPKDNFETSQDYSPWQLLPAPEPCTVRPPPGYFYNNVARHLVRDTVRIMSNGLPIDLSRVIELEKTLDKTLAEVRKTLNNNPIVIRYMEARNKHLINLYKLDRKEKMRDPSYYLKPFDHKKMEHRSYFMYLLAKQQNWPQPSELLPTGIPKWTANDVKKLAKSRPILQRLVEGKLEHPLIEEAMQLFAEHKATIYNEKYLAQINNPDIDLPEFNPGSSSQKHELFTDMLGLESDKLGKAWTQYERDIDIAIRQNRDPTLIEVPKNKFSWDRDNVEKINKSTDDPELKELTQALIDYSFGAIVKDNFIAAFYKYTVNGRLYGQYKLLGAKSG